MQALACGADFNECGRTRALHFNSLYSQVAIERRWSDLHRFVAGACAQLNARPGSALDQASYEVLIGAVSHAIQDFYAHSNWAGILQRQAGTAWPREEFPTWDEAMDPSSGWAAAHPDFDLGPALRQMRLSNEGPSGDEQKGGLQTGRVHGETFSGTRPWRHRHKGGAEGQIVQHLARRATRAWIERIDARLDGTQPSEASRPAHASSGGTPPTSR